MPISTNSSESQYGSVVAVEGNADLVATQLRLLPPSSKILILPALSTALPSVSAEPFEARRWVRYVHNAFTARYETAHSFLQSSTSDQPRLVFINGGSVSARVECIYRIAEQLTNGRIAEAEAIFNDIVKNGVAGILRPDQVEQEVITEDIVTVEDRPYPEREKVSKPHDYRGAIAMEAADRLDRQTAELQSTPRSETFQESRGRGRGGSHSLLDSQQSEYRKSQEHEKEDYPDFSGARIRKTVVTIPDGLDEQISKKITFGMLPATTYSPNWPAKKLANRESVYNHDEEAEEDLLSTGDKSASEVLPGLIEVGQAQVIRVESNGPPRNMRSIKSVDRLNPGTTKNRRRSRSLTPKLISAHAIAHRTAALKGFRHERRASLSDLEKAPQTAFVRAVPTIIKKSSGKSSLANSVKSPRPVYVDRGTDAHPAWFAGEAIPPTPNTVETEKEIPSFQPVFAIVEDLIIHFTDGADNSLLESVVRSYKTGNYPVTPISESELQSPQPNSPRGLTEERLRHLSNWTAETDDSGYHRRGEINPYGVENVEPELRHLWLPQKRGTRIENPIVSTPAPLSPAATPPPTRTSVAHRFHRFSPMNSKTATGIQNSLRAVLNVHYPPELTNHRQYSVPVEGDRLWKPVFRNSDGHSQEGRTVDQIIAIGAEDGVNSNFFNEIAGQVERLGTKKNGTTRSGKLDMRFLIASAMQTFTKQSLSYQSQSSSSPFSSPMLLASLLVPQLEMYLASNAGIRLLVIHYSSSHLPTILALRHLVGAETIKIAGIVDSLYSESTLKQPPSVLPVGNRLSNANVAAYNARTRVSQNSATTSTRSIKDHSPSQSIEFKHNSSEPVSTSFSRANYLLPSTASEVEIASFLSNITNHLIEKSSYYTPEPTLFSTRKSAFNSPATSPLSPTFPSNPSATLRKTTNPPIPNPRNSSLPATPQGRYHEKRVGQSINNNVIRPQSKHNSNATSNINENGDNQSNSPTSKSFKPPSTHRFSPSVSSNSSLSNQHPTYPPTSPTSNHTPTISNSSNVTLLNSNQKPNHKRTNTNTSNRILGANGNGNSRPNTAAREADARERQSERDWANFYIGDSDEDDEIDRILMPRVQRRIDRKKGNSRKALKWLGLA